MNQNFPTFAFLSLHVLFAEAIKMHLSEDYLTAGVTMATDGVL